MSRFGGVQVLVYNAGLTFTTIDLARFRRAEPQKFWQVSDDILRAVIETNYIAADQMARRVASTMVEQGWGRIVNVTTKLDTMNRPHTSPYGASKAALEMATEVWAKEVEGTGLTINIVNPGAGAYTPAWPRKCARRPRLAPRRAREMLPPLLYVVSRKSDDINGYRFDANLWDCRYRWPKQLAAPASKCTRNRIDAAGGGHSSGKPARRRPTFTVFSRSAQYGGLVIQGK